MTAAETETDGLDDLRRDLARLVLDEAGRAVAREPGLPLAGALVQAVERQVSEAAERERQRTPDAEALSAAVLATLRPELIRIVQAASSGDTRGLATDGARMPGALGMGLAVAAAILLFAAGFVAARVTTPVHEPAPVAWPVVTEQAVAAGKEDGSVLPAEGAAVVVPETVPQAQAQTSAPTRNTTTTTPTTRRTTTPAPHVQTPASTPNAPATIPTTTTVTETPPA